MILIVSEEPALLSTRAAVLSEWDCETTNIVDAPDALCAGIYDLIVFCQTVPEPAAIELLRIARKVNEVVKVLTILPTGSTFDRAYEKATYTVNFAAPERLREAVASILPTLPRGWREIVVLDSKITLAALLAMFTTDLQLSQRCADRLPLTSQAAPHHSIQPLSDTREHMIRPASVP